MPDQAKLQILVADDDPAIRRLLEKLLTAAGYEVRNAADGLQAVEAVLERCPDLLILDWDMPGLTGPEVCRRLREMTLPHYLYMLLLTVKSHSDDMIAGLQAGADDFVSKPVVRMELLARLQSGARLRGMESRLRDLSERDPLTGILNRRTFRAHFDREWRRSLRSGAPLSCVLLDIDFFKKVNDDYGHVFGDATLKVVAEVIAGQCRTTDFACRYGGEEFCVLLPDTNEAGAAVWAERLREVIAAYDIRVSDSAPLRVTVSLGIAARLDDTSSPDDMINLADQALLVAKQSGRNRVVRISSLDDPILELNGPAENGNPLDGVLARDVMATIPLSLHQDDGIQRATEYFVQLRVGSAPVVDDEGRLVGVLSEKDLMLIAAQNDSWKHTIRDFMKRNVVAYDERAPASKVFQFLCRVSIRRVVVVREGSPIGMISRTSLLQWFRNWMTMHGVEAPSWDLANARQGLRQTAAMLADVSSRLCRALATDDDDVVPLVVAEATRMQDLTSDLLGHCQTGQSARY